MEQQPFACKVCQAAMKTVMDMKPDGNNPGLKAYVCDACGATDAVTVNPPSDTDKGDQNSERR